MTQAEEKATDNAAAIPYRSTAFWAGLGIGMLLFGIIGAAGIWVTVQIPVAIYEPPVEYFDLQRAPDRSLCAGDTLTFTVGVRYNDAAIVDTYRSIRDLSSGTNVLGTQSSVGVRMQPRPTQFYNTVAIPVPATLPPGPYEFISASVSVNMDAKPAFVNVPFTVTDDCP